MGGKAFTHVPHSLSTPRLPPALYHTLLSQCLSLLSTFYTHAISPIPAPEKTSYGDIDILVTGPLSPSSLASIPVALNAHARLTGVPGAQYSFAVPYPGSPKDYVQVDVHILSSLSALQWQLFTNNHGDIWNLLGSSLRPFGLTANGVGFHVRIPEIEEIDRKKSMVFLTSDPSAVLKFLGLDGERYWRSFETLEEMYGYVKGMRFFRRDSYIRETLKPNDRKRVKQRPMYRKFVEEWLPRQPEGLVREWNEDMRVEALEEALRVFDKYAEKEKMTQDWRRERTQLRMKQDINERRKRKARKEMEYADAWIEALKLVS